MKAKLQQPVRLLYIASSGRSGSTVVERWLARRLGATCLGEARQFANRGMAQNELCSCRAPFRDCEFWSAAVGCSGPGVDAAGIAKQLQDASRFRRIPSNILRRSAGGISSPVGIDMLANAYEKALEHSDLVIDSSKDPAFLALLLRHTLIPVGVIHLVRDPRAVAYSWQRKKLRPEISGGRAYMPRLPAGTVARRWNVYNGAIELVKRRAARSVTLRYEDFVSNPETEYDRVRSELGLMSGSRFDHHQVSGNPSRFKGDFEELKLDTEWSIEMSRRARVLVGSMTAPLAAYYGYRPKIGR